MTYTEFLQSNTARDNIIIFDYDKTESLEMTEYWYGTEYAKLYYLQYEFINDEIISGFLDYTIELDAGNSVGMYDTIYDAGDSTTDYVIEVDAGTSLTTYDVYDDSYVSAGDSTTDYSIYLQGPSYRNKFTRENISNINTVLADDNYLIEVGNRALCSISDETFYFDEENQRLYINSGQYGLKPDEVWSSIILGYKIGFANKAGYYDGIYYEGRIRSLPSIDTSRDDFFKSVISFQGGAVTLINTDGFFDDIAKDNIYGSNCSISYFLQDKKLIDDPNTVELDGGGSANTYETTIDAGDSTTDYDLFSSGGSSSTTYDVYDDPYVDAGDSSTDYDIYMEPYIVDVPTFRIPIYSGYIKDYQYSAAEFTINFKDSREILKEKIPPKVYDESIYGEIDDENKGEVIAWAYGKINKAPAICLNETDDAATTYNFKFVDTTRHDIQSIDAVYVENKSVSYTNGSLTQGTFDLSNTVYEPGDKVTVSFHGFVDGGDLITNPLDIIKDIIINTTVIDFNNIYFNTEEWEIARNQLTQKIGIYIGERKSIVDVIEQITASIFGVFKIDRDGLFNFKFRDPDKEKSSTIYIDELIDSPTIEYNSDEYINSARIKYNRYWESDRGTFYTDDDKKSDLFSIYKINKEQEFDTVLYDDLDVQEFASDIMDMFGGIFPTFTIRTKLQHLEEDIEDNINIEIKRYFDQTSAVVKAEIISKSINLNDYTIEFRARFIESLTAENLAELIRYRNDTSYTSGQVVGDSAGSLWRAIVTTEGNPPQPDSSFWEEFVTPEADKLSTARNIELSGDVTGSEYFDGSSDIIINTTVGTLDSLTTTNDITTTSGDVVIGPAIIRYNSSTNSIEFIV